MPTFSDNPPVCIEHGKSSQLRAAEIARALDHSMRPPIETDLALRFEDQAQLQEYVASAKDDLAETYGTEMPSIRALLENRQMNASRIARMGDQSGMGANRVGTLVHRVAEIRTLEDESYRILHGRMRVEQRVNGFDRHNYELDLVQVRGHTHYIRDYKPVNLARLLKDSTYGPQFLDWVNRHHNGDFTRMHGFKGMSDDLRTCVQSEIKRQIRQHKSQLEDYKAAYVAATGIELYRIKLAIHPYWVWRP